VITYVLPLRCSGCSDGAHDELAAYLCGLADRATVVAGEAVISAARLAPVVPWRLVFVDPPYRSDLAVRAVAALPPDHLAADAVVVIEHDRHNAPPDQVGSLLRTDQRRYGDTLISFFAAPRGGPA